MTYQLSEEQLQKITKLPEWMQELKDLYPVTISNVAEDYELPPLPAEYCPYAIENYDGEDAEDSYLFVLDRKPYSINLEAIKNTNILRVMVDGSWAYIQINERVLLDRLGGILLPSSKKSN